MDKNVKLYNVSLHLYHAAILLSEIDRELKQELLDKAENILKDIKINEKEIQEIEKYKQKLMEVK